MKKKQQGLTLIEMMIAMVVGLIITGSVIAIFISNIKSTTENMKMTRLNQELRGAMTFISDEIKRAGYSADAANFDFIADFDFVSNCLRYSYDDDGNGTRSINERFGFQLDASTGILSWASGLTTTDCSDPDVTWEEITDPNIAEITAFSGDATPVSVGTIDIGHFVISITGQVELSPNNAVRTISEIVRVRNEDAR